MVPAGMLASRSATVTYPGRPGTPSVELGLLSGGHCSRANRASAGLVVVMVRVAVVVVVAMAVVVRTLTGPSAGCQQPGCPRFPQQLDPVRTFRQLFASARRTFVGNGAS